MAKFKIGDIVFFKGSSFYSRLIYSYNFINYGQKGFSHVGIITQVNKDSVLIHEALSNGFVKSYYGKEWLNNKIDKTIKIKRSKIKLTNVLKNSDKYLGRSYGWFDIFSIGLAFLTRFKISFTGANKLICSEAVSRILYDSSYKKLNLSLEFNKPYDLITPMDICYSKDING